MKPEVKAAADRLSQFTRRLAEEDGGDCDAAAYDDLQTLLHDHARLEREAFALREALYPMVVECLTADVHEDAPSFEDGEAYRGKDSLPKCDGCGGVGATDGRLYEDESIPKHLVCGVCEGWGFLKHPRAVDEAGALGDPPAPSQGR